MYGDRIDACGEIRYNKRRCIRGNAPLYTDAIVSAETKSREEKENGKSSCYI